MHVCALVVDGNDAPTGEPRTEAAEKENGGADADQARAPEASGDPRGGHVRPGPPNKRQKGPVCVLLGICGALVSSEHRSGDCNEPRMQASRPNKPLARRLDFSGGALDPGDDPAEQATRPAGEAGAGLFVDTHA